MANLQLITALATSAIPLLDSSSSSDSDSGLEELLPVLLRTSGKKFRRKRPRLEHFFDSVVDEYSDEEFHQHFHLKRATAELITTYFEASDFCTMNVGTGRKNVSARQQMLAFFWFCANKNSYSEISKLFNIANSTFSKCLNNILDFFNDLSKYTIRFTRSKYRRDRVINGFKKIAGIDNVIGCIDTCYFKIRKPAKQDNDTFMMTLQAVCDSRSRFVDVCIGSPSRIYKSKVYALSPVSERLSEICQERYHLLGDNAYPLREYLITPYLGSHLTAKQKKFNQAHYETRATVNHAFNILKQRFRQLTKLDFFHIERMCKFILACCTLHNLCIDFDDEWEDEDGDDDNNKEEEHNYYRTGFIGESSAPPKTSQRYKIRNNGIRRLGVIRRKELSRRF